jgi:hypothetical protein
MPASSSLQGCGEHEPSVVKDRSSMSVVQTPDALGNVGWSISDMLRGALVDIRGLQKYPSARRLDSDLDLVSLHRVDDDPGWAKLGRLTLLLGILVALWSWVFFRWK